MKLGDDANKVASATWGTAIVNVAAIARMRAHPIREITFRPLWNDMVLMASCGTPKESHCFLWRFRWPTDVNSTRGTWNHVWLPSLASARTTYRQQLPLKRTTTLFIA